MSLKPSRNIMSPINPHRRSQEILNQHKPNQPALPFYTKKGGSCLDFSTYTRQSIPDNVTVPSEYGGDTVLYKQCQVFTCLPLVLQTKQTRSLTFLPLSAPDFAYIFFPLDTLIGYECWSHPLHNTKPQSGTVAATTEEVRSRLLVHSSSCVCVFFCGDGVILSECHTLL